MAEAAHTGPEFEAGRSERVRKMHVCVDLGEFSGLLLHGCVDRTCQCAEKYGGSEKSEIEKRLFQAAGRFS